MSQLYYIHSPADWDSADIAAIKTKMEQLDFQESRDAAIGEGAGGAGFETVVEVVLNNQITAGLISTVIFEVAKYLWGKRPTKKQLPKQLPAKLNAYRLVVHIENSELHTIVGVDLKSDIKDIETAITVNLVKKLEDNPTRVYQHGDDWDIF